MLSNIFLFTWTETYLLDKELLRRKENFARKFGSESIFLFWIENLDIGLLKQAIYGWGLFTTKKLIIVYGLPLDATTKLGEDTNAQIHMFVDSLIKAEGKIPEDSWLIFVSSTPDKRLKLYKFLEKYATKKEFAQLKHTDLDLFVRQELGDCTIRTPVVQYFLTKVGSDLYRICSECDKLKTRSSITHQKNIDEAMIDTVVFWQVETDSFILLKTLFTDTLQAIKILEKIQYSGTDRNQFIGMLYWAMKFYIFMIDLDENGIHDSATIASFLKMNPWQVKNEYTKIDLLKLHKKNIEIFYIWLITLDTSIKSWKYPDTYFWLGIKKLIHPLVD